LTCQAFAQYAKRIADHGARITARGSRLAARDGRCAAPLPHESGILMGRAISAESPSRPACAERRLAIQATFTV